MFAYTSLKRLVVLSALTIGMGSGVSAFAADPAPRVDDGALVSQVQTALANDSLLRGAKITVESTDGVVWLSGVVDDSRQWIEAYRVTVRVSGVRSVKNRTITLYNPN